MKKLIPLLLTMILAVNAFGADTHKICLNEFFKVQFFSVNDANEIIETTLLAESFPVGTIAINDLNNIVIFTPETTGTFYFEVSLEPVDANDCWIPPKRFYVYEITVNPTRTWTTTAAVSSESK